MYITWLELKKALLSPVFFILLLIILAFNIFTIVINSHNKEELKIVNNIIETYGPSFNDEILQTMEEDILQLVKQLGWNNTQTFFDEMTSEQYSEASLEEQRQIDHISLLYTYVQEAKVLEARYSTIDINKLKQEFIDGQTMPGWLEQKMENEFDTWHERFDEIVATNEYKQWFFLGDYRMHSELFRSQMKTLAIEGIFIIVLLTAFITNYEYEQRSHLVTYATKKGRKLIWHKGAASLIGSLIMIAVLFGGTLATYFTVYDYSAVWQIPITSGMNWEYNLPYITWWKIELWQFLLLVIAIIIVVLIIVVLLTFTISIYVKNSYFTWLLCIILLVAMYVVPSYFTNSFIQWIMHYNITLIILNPHQYFNGGTNFMMMQYHELWTLLIWIFVSLAAIMMASRYFSRKDVA